MTEDKKYNAAIIGCGRIGCGDFDDHERRSGIIYGHTASYLACPQTELIALCDSNKNQLNKYSKKYSANSYTNYKEMLEKESIDIISICTPPSTHCDIIEDCLSSNIKALYCEKPIDECIDKASYVTKKCRDKGVLLAINHQLLSGLIRSGDLGSIEQISVFYGAGISNTGTHFIDLLNFYLGKEVDWVYGIKSQNKCSLKFDLNIDGFISYKEGPLASIQSTNAFGILEIIFITTLGRFTVNMHHPFTTDPIIKFEKIVDNVFFEGATKLEKCKDSFNIRWIHSQDHNDMFSGILEICKCLDEEKLDIVSNGETGVSALKIIDALVLSSNKDIKIFIEP